MSSLILCNYELIPYHLRLQSIPNYTAMKDLFRETMFGHAVRLLSGGKYLAHNEALNPREVQMYQPADSEASSRSGISGSQLDPEKGKDTKLVEWAKNDPQNPRNWSTPKKLFVTFEICLLTTSVYIGNCLPGDNQMI